MNQAPLKSEKEAHLKKNATKSKTKSHESKTRKTTFNKKFEYLKHHLELKKKKTRMKTQRNKKNKTKTKVQEERTSVTFQKSFKIRTKKTMN